MKPTQTGTDPSELAATAAVVFPFVRSSTVLVAALTATALNVAVNSSAVVFRESVMLLAATI